MPDGEGNIDIGFKFDKEFKISWDEITPSLQARFLHIEDGTNVTLNGMVIGQAAANQVKYIPTEDIGGNLWIGKHTV